MDINQLIDYVRQGGLPLFLLILWWLERRERLAAEERERIRMAARAVDGDRPDETKLPQGG